MKKILIKTLDCFFLLRIPLLAPVWTIVILGWVAGSPKAHWGGCLIGGSAFCGVEVSLWIALFGFSLVVAAIYVGNQIADIESDRINHKLFLLPHGLVSVRTAWILAGVCSAGGLLTALFFDGTMLFLFVTSLALGFMYDLPPASLKNRPWGGTIACFLGHGVLTFLVGWYAARFTADPEFAWSLRDGVRLDVLAQGFLPSLSAGFANAAVFVTTTIADAEGDKAIGKRTFSVAYGEHASAIAGLVFCVGALATVWFIQYNRVVMLIPTVLSLALFAWLVLSTSRDAAFKAFKWPVFLLSAFVAVFVPVYGVLIVVTFFGSKMYYRHRFHIDYPTFKSR